MRAQIATAPSLGLLAGAAACLIALLITILPH
jgi:hypothetical protein